MTFDDEPLVLYEHFSLPATFPLRNSLINRLNEAFNTQLKLSLRENQMAIQDLTQNELSLKEELSTKLSQIE
jgi:hypothetical protein